MADASVPRSRSSLPGAGLRYDPAVPVETRARHPADRGPRGHRLEPVEGPLPGGGHHEARRGALLPRGRRRRVARRRWSTRTSWCAMRTASRASSSTRSARRPRAADWVETCTIAFPSGRTADEIVPRDAATLAWMANLGCLELHPHPVRTDDLDHPDELRVDLDPVPGVEWTPDRRAWPAWCGRRCTTSGSSAGRRPRGRAACTSTCVSSVAGRSPRSGGRRSRWRARSSAARHASRPAGGGRRSATASSSTTTRTPRIAPSRARTRSGPRPDARVSAPVTWDELASCRPERLHAAHDAGALRAARRSPRRDRRASGLARDAAGAVATAGGGRARRCALAAALRQAGGRADARRAVAGERSGEPASGARRQSTKPLVEIGRSRSRDDALAGLERWKARHPDAAARLEPRDVLIDAMRGRFTTWTRVRVNLEHVPPELRPGQEPLDPADDPTEEWRVSGGGGRRRRSPPARTPE